MKKIILLLWATALLNFSGHTQICKPPAGYTVMSDKDLKKGLMIISDYKIYKIKAEELIIKFKKGAILSDSLIEGKTIVIRTLREKESLLQDISDSKDRQIITRDETINKNAIELKASIKRGNKKGINGFLQGTVIGAVVAIVAKIFLFK